MRHQQSGHPPGHFLGQPVRRALEHLEAVGSAYIATAQLGRGPGHEAVAIAPQEKRGHLDPAGARPQAERDGPVPVQRTAQGSRVRRPGGVAGRTAWVQAGVHQGGPHGLTAAPRQRQLGQRRQLKGGHVPRAGRLVTGRKGPRERLRMGHR